MEDGQCWAAVYQSPCAVFCLILRDVGVELTLALLEIRDAEAHRQTCLRSAWNVCPYCFILLDVSTKREGKEGLRHKREENDRN